MSPAQRKAWARLIQKIYEVDPLTCPKCKGSMKIIAFIEEEEEVKEISKHVSLWLAKAQPGEAKSILPPKAHSPAGDLHTGYSGSQIALWDDDQTSGSYTHILYL